MRVHECTQNDDLWFKLHIGIPTASSAKSLVTPNGEPSKGMKPMAEKLASDKFAGEAIDQWQGNRYTDRGHEIEPLARLYYEMLYPDAVVTQVGFVTDDLMRWGCSPDSMVDDIGLLEIKCLPKAHTAYIREIHRTKLCPAAFVPQVQCQLFITERKWCDILFYHEKLPKKIVRVFPDRKIFTTLKKQLSACIAERNLVLKELESM